MYVSVGNYNEPCQGMQIREQQKAQIRAKMSYKASSLHMSATRVGFFSSVHSLPHITTFA